MPTVRVGAAVALLLFAFCPCLADEPTPWQSARPMIGTGGFGHTYPGATVPFGMVQLSPDTRLGTWEGCSGYCHDDTAILGFSHTHLSGTGCLDLGDVRVIPLAGDADTFDTAGYPRLPFSHSDETARPGYYSVLLGEPRIKAELTATAHAGFHRYTFPAGQPVSLLIDVDRGIGNHTVASGATIESDRRIVGYRQSRGWADDKTFYFAAEFSRPFDRVTARERQRTEEKNVFKPLTFTQAGGKAANGHREVSGECVLLRARFQNVSEPILVKVGLSAVSVEAARKNLAAEIPGWDFAGTVAAAERSWNDLLGRIEIKTSDQAVRETFYTSLYHVAMAPTLFNDADGGYCGLDHADHPDGGFQNYSTFSLWDTFRAEHPLLTILQPHRVDDFVNSMLAHQRQFDQHLLPLWSLAGNETWCMIGNHSIPVIVDAYLKGFRGFDAEAAYQAIRATSMQDRSFLGEYRRLGYVPSDKKNRKKQSVSRTLEYGYDDWCVAQMARALGKTEDAKLFERRAQAYRNVIDPSVGFARGRLADGQWRAPFEPNVLVWDDYTEATAWNYTWFVPHDVPGLIGLLGGDAACIAKLDRMFQEDSRMAVTGSPDLTGLIGQYVHGNEPCHHVAYLYCYAGAPWKTQARVRQIMTTLYNNRVDGMCGNDDCGQMSAWYVFSALGLYPVNPSSSVYVLGSPLVDQATIHLDPKFHKGRTFTMVAENNSPKNVYIQSALLNGKPLQRCWLSHAEITGGGQLVLRMGPEPNMAWGQRPEDRPPATAVKP
ncbi:MAG: GH92 family glycosyl hydrolase [Thermoguttaceae bacterium]